MPSASTSTSHPPWRRFRHLLFRVVWGLAWLGVIVGGAVLVARRFAQRIGQAVDQARAQRLGVARLTSLAAGQERRAEAAEATAGLLQAEVSGLRDELTQIRAELAEARRSNLFLEIRAEIAELPTQRTEPAPTQALRDDAGDEPHETCLNLETQLALLKQARDHVRNAIRRTQVLNRTEGQMFRRFLDWSRANNLRLLPQVSMGEYLTPQPGSSELLWTYNQRRTDFLICDWHWRPLLAIEHHGGGHFQGNWRLRDDIKAEALAIAEVGLVVTLDGEDVEDVGDRLDDELRRIRRLRAEKRRKPIAKEIHGKARSN